MSARRGYEEGCAVAHALDLVGDRWALLVVRELLYGPRRFSDLGRSLPGASTSMLTQRLKDLCEAGVARRYQLPAPAASWVYELTDWGAELKTVVIGLGTWATGSPSFDPAQPVTACSMALGIESFFDLSAAGDARGTLDLELDNQVFRVDLADSGLSVSGGVLPGPADAKIVARPGDLKPFLWDKKRVTKSNLTRHNVRIAANDRRAVELLAGICGTA